MQHGKTRHEVTRLVYTSPLPTTMNGMTLKKSTEEVFIAPNGQTTMMDAINILEKIRDVHPAKNDNGTSWYCVEEGVFEENGRYFAYRHHGLYEK